MTATSTATPARILITGYSGFVGRYLVRRCAEHYPAAELFGLSNRAPDQTPTDDDPGAPVVRHLQVDIGDADAVRHALAESRPDLVFHLAAQASVAESWTDPAGTLAINAGGAVHLLEGLHTEGLHETRVVLIGSGEQYGVVQPEDNPIRESQPLLPVNPYAVAKATQDLFGYQYFAAYGMPIMRVRPFNHFGPGQTPTFVIAGFAEQIARIEAGGAEPVLHVGNLAAQRDFLFVEDVVRAYIAIADEGVPGAAYNVGSGTPHTIKEVLDILLSFTPAPIDVRVDPQRFRPIDAPLAYADTALLREHTGWTPQHTLRDALFATLESYRDTMHVVR